MTLMDFGLATDFHGSGRLLVFLSRISQKPIDVELHRYEPLQKRDGRIPFEPPGQVTRAIVIG